MYRPKNCSAKSVVKIKRDNINFNSQINDDYILVNPYEIYNLVSNDKDYIELINHNFLKIKEYFPQSLIYLEFVKDYEGDGRESLAAKIYNPYEDYERSRKQFNSFLLENIDTLLSKDYNFYLSIIPTDEHIIKRIEEFRI